MKGMILGVCALVLRAAGYAALGVAVWIWFGPPWAALVGTAGCWSIGAVLAEAGARSRPVVRRAVRLDDAPIIEAELVDDEREGGRG